MAVSLLLSDGAVTDHDGQRTYWVALPVEDRRLVDRPADVPVYGSSLALLLDAALDSHGEIAHLETGRLRRVVGRAAG